MRGESQSGDPVVEHPFPDAPDGSVAVIVNSEHRVLIIQRAQGVDAPGWWCFPGGRIRDGESPQDAAVREAREEVGLIVRARRELWRCELSQGTRLIWFLCDPVDDRPIRLQREEVAAYRWIRFDEIPEIPDLLPSNRALFDAVQGEI